MLREHIDAALAKLEESYHTRDARMTFLGVEPKWDPMADIPEFLDLLRRMNLEFSRPVLEPPGLPPGN